MKNTFLNSITFPVVAEFELLEFAPHHHEQLVQPSGLSKVLLCSNWKDQKYREVDFTGTSNAEAILKILMFYGHKLYRRMIGPRQQFRGLAECDTDRMLVLLSV